MSHVDPYTNPDRQGETTLQAMITRLEERGQHPQFLRMIREYVSTLPKDHPLSVVDIGCGTGVVTREIAKFVHPASLVHGADISRGLLDHAQRLDPEHRIQWDHITSETLPYADAGFDVVVMHTLLSHVPDVTTMLAQTSRILKPGGKLIVFDADHASTTYGHPDYATMRHINFLLSSAIATHPDVCCQLPRYLKAAGFELESHQSEVLSECAHGNYWLSSVRGFARMLPSLGILAPDEADAWINHMMTSHQEGTFFASGAFYTFYAQRN